MEKLPNLGWGGQQLNDKLAKAVQELQGLTLSGPLDGASAGTAIAIDGLVKGSHVFKVLQFDGAATPPAFTDVSSHTSIIDGRAVGTITCLATIADGDYVTVNGKRYTFKSMTVTPSTNVAPFVVPVTITDGSCDRNAAAAALAKAIMSGDNNITCVVADNVVTVVWRTAGTAGNAKTLTTSSAHATVSGATLTGGTASVGITLDVDTSSKKLLVFWFNPAGDPQVIVENAY